MVDVGFMQKMKNLELAWWSVFWVGKILILINCAHNLLPTMQKPSNLHTYHCRISAHPRVMAVALSANVHTSLPLQLWSKLQKLTFVTKIQILQSDWLISDTKNIISRKLKFFRGCNRAKNHIFVLSRFLRYISTLPPLA